MDRFLYEHKILAFVIPVRKIFYQGRERLLTKNRMTKVDSVIAVLSSSLCLSVTIVLGLAWPFYADSTSRSLLIDVNASVYKSSMLSV